MALGAVQLTPQSARADDQLPKAEIEKIVPRVPAARARSDL